MIKFLKAIRKLVIDIYLKFGILFFFKYDYKGNPRDFMPVAPYFGKSPIVLLYLNFLEIINYHFLNKVEKEAIAKTKNLKNSKSGQTALILGNGPSLRTIIPEKVNEDSPDIFAVNDFYKNTRLTQLKVTFYVISDPIYFSATVSNKPNEKLNEILKFVSTTNSKLVLPQWASKFMQNSNQIIYFDDRDLSSWSSSTSPVRPRGYISLTLYKALALAIYLGYGEIYVLGMDNTEYLNFTSDSDNSILNSSNHSYATGNEKSIDFSELFSDGLPGAFAMYAQTFGDLRKFKGNIFNLDQHSLTTQFPKTICHKWIDTSI